MEAVLRLQNARLAAPAGGVVPYLHFLCDPVQDELTVAASHLSADQR